MVIKPTEELEDINEIPLITPTLESVVKQIVKKIAVKQPVPKPVVKQQTVKKAVVVEQLSTPTRDVLDKISALFNSAVSDDSDTEISEIEESSASNIFAGRSSAATTCPTPVVGRGFRICGLTRTSGSRPPWRRPLQTGRSS